MFSTDPSSLQNLPRSEFIKRRAYWQLWRKANNPEAEEELTSAPGVTISRRSNLPDGAVIVGS